MAGKVLIVATSFPGPLGATGPTGSWVEEVATPYYALRTSGIAVDFASIKGGPIPFDPASKEGDFLTREAAAFLKDDAAQKLVQQTKSVEEVLGGEVEIYDAVFLPGGHGIVFDGPDSPSLKLLLETLWAGGKIVSAVCHGPSGLVSASAPNGEPIVKGKRVTGFTNTEEIAVKKNSLVPFLLEDRLKELGGLFERGPDWTPHAVRDGQLITGQNPQSSRRVAELIVEAILPGIEPVHGKGEGEGFHHRTKPVTGEHHDHRDDHPFGQGTRHDVSHHPEANKAQANQPIRQTTHTNDPTRHTEHPDRSYTAI